jgi:polysaccharide biosynthesis PFTS motif protein
MTMTLFSAWVLRGRARLRATIRGYTSLKRNGNLGLVRRIRGDLADCRLGIESGDVAGRIFGAASTHAETAVRQYLLERLLGVAFNKSLLYSIGHRSPLAYPLPRRWRDAISARGIPVNGARSAALWAAYLCKCLARGIHALANMLLASTAVAFRGQLVSGKRYAYLDCLSLSNMPNPDARGASYDICTWYSRWEGRMVDLGFIGHDVACSEKKAAGVPVRMVPQPYNLLSGAALVRLAIWGLATIIEAVLHLMMGRWWYVVLLSEAIRAKSVQLCPPERLPKDYLFHYSGTLYRPLWTYEAEAKGGRIICYFYSTYEQPGLPGDDYASQSDWGPALWPLYLVWDKYQDEQLRRNISSCFNTIITGPIPFSTGEVRALSVPHKSVAVFDIEPHRLGTHFPFSTLADFIAANPDYSTRFLMDIQQALDDCGFTMAFKRKRESGSKGQKSYKKLVKELSQKSNVMIVPPDVSAMQLIKRCVAVISMPFTSTALYWREQDIPSAYYDPTGWIQRGDRAAHDIPILIGVSELKQWLRETVVHKTYTWKLLD